MRCFYEFIRISCYLHDYVWYENYQVIYTFKKGIKFFCIIKALSSDDLFLLQTFFFKGLKYYDSQH